MHFAAENLESLKRVYRAVAGRSHTTYFAVVSQEARRYLDAAACGILDVAHGAWLLDVVDQGLALASLLIDVMEGYRAILSAGLEEEGEDTAQATTEALADLADSTDHLRSWGTQMLVYRVQIQKVCSRGTGEGHT